MKHHEEQEEKEPEYFKVDYSKIEKKNYCQAAKHLFSKTVSGNLRIILVSI
jgi:hypothetical protein